MAKIAGVVIVFFPDLDKLIFNIDTYINQVEQLFIVFNSPVSDDVFNRLQRKYSKIQLVINNENIGIASALNQTAIKAINLGYEWLLTMDQDSYFQSDLLFKVFSRSKIQNTAIFSPTSVDASEIKKENSDASTEDLNVITSGNILNLIIWKTIGGFEEKLFIDEVDNDYCLKAISNGFKIIRFNNISLIHELGQNKEVTFLFKKYTIITHPPIRAYYIFRNNFYIFNKYKNKFPEFVRSRKIMLIKVFMKILLFSTQRFQTLIFIIKGIRDYSQNLYGPYNENVQKSNLR